MGKKEFIDKSTGLYVPSLEEMGLTEAEAVKMSVEQFDKEVEKWQLKDREKKAAKALQKQKELELKLSNHWFYKETQSVKAMAIERSRLLADEIIDEMLNHTKLESMRYYYESLRVRVKFANMIFLPASSDKLKRFPRLDSVNKKLFGSRHSYIKLWSHVFPADGRIGAQRGRVY